MPHTRTVKLLDVTLYGVEAGSGHRFHFQIGEDLVDVDRWATENSSGQDAYIEGEGATLDEEVDEVVTEQIDAFEAAFDSDGQLHELQTRLVAETIAAVNPSTVVTIDQEG